MEVEIKQEVFDDIFPVDAYNSLGSAHDRLVVKKEEFDEFSSTDPSADNSEITQKEFLRVKDESFDIEFIEEEAEDSDRRQYRCGECRKEFNSQQDLVNHLEEGHAKNKKTSSSFQIQLPSTVMSLEKWNSQTTIKFIQEFQSEKCLWNQKSPSYKNKPARETAYKRVAEEMRITGFGVPEAKKKMRILRSTYYQERKKIQNSLRSGSLYVPNLPWYKEMDNILRNVDERRTTVENVSEQVHTECTHATAAKVSKRKGIFRAIGELKTLQKLINKNEPGEEKEDRFDVFGKSVAMQLRALSYERGMIGQARIQNILTEISIEDYRRTNISTSSDTSSSSRSTPLFHTTEEVI